ncbi:MAG: hypothetical protein HYW01_05770 [Deltaproteobacteria bacterium]|nr:hypothetical protein [Deltaproteobacteria bacterium]
MSKFKNILTDSIDAIKNKANEVVEKNPEIVNKAKKLASDVHKKYVESGAEEKVDIFTNKSSEKLDEISGHAMYKLVEERLAEQDRFNDLLATKLHEALERISELERKLLQKSKQS